MSAPHVIYWDEWLSGWEVGPDAATARLALTPSSTDIEDSLDAATEYLALTPSSSDTAQYVDVGVIFPPDEANLGSGGDSDFPFGNTTRDDLAQSFLSPGNYSVERIEAKVLKFGAPSDNLVIELRSDSSNSPGTVLASCTVSGTSLSTTATFVTFPFSSIIDLTSGTRYWIVASRSGSVDNVNNYGWSGQTSDTYPGGVAAQFALGVWTLFSTRDLSFKVHFEPSPTSVKVSLTPSVTDAAQFVDAATELLKLSPYVPEEYPVVPFKLTPSSSDIAQFIDQNTESFLLTPSASDTAQYVDPTTPPDEAYLERTGSAGPFGETLIEKRAQSFTAPGSYIVSRAQLSLQKLGSPTDNLIIQICSDSGGSPGTVLATATIVGSSLSTSLNLITFFFDNDVSVISGSTYWIVASRDGSLDNTNRYAWERTTPGNYAGGVAKNFQSGSWASDSTRDHIFVVSFYPNPLPRISLTPSTTFEEHTIFDAATESFLLTPSTSERADFADTNTESLALIPASSDIAQFIDAAAERLALSILSSDIASFVDANTEQFALTPSGTDTFVPSGFTGVDYLDANTETLALTASATDIIAAQDAAIQRLSLSPRADDTAQFSDSALEILTLTPTFTETIQGSDTSVEALYLAPSSADIAQFIDELEVYLRLHPSAYELYKIYELLATVGEMRWGGIAYQHYFSKMDLLKYSASIMFKRWWGRID